MLIFCEELFREIGFGAIEKWLKNEKVLDITREINLGMAWGRKKVTSIIVTYVAYRRVRLATELVKLTKLYLKTLLKFVKN